MSNIWLLQRQDERWFAFAAIINDPRREIDAAGLWQLQVAAERLLAAAR
jgi:putative SOS response-associated peptidase YedK